MKATDTHTPGLRNAPRRLAALAGASVCSLALCAGVAGAQSSGGTTSPGGGTTTPTTPPATTPSPSGAQQVFPLPGPHIYRDGFGAGRGHQGADLFAACGQTEVAVMKSRVATTGFHGAAGHYIVLRAKKIKRDYVYMHLRKRSELVKGQVVKAGQWVGAVGDSGNASGCHLHFEIWKGKWYGGGNAIDPVPSLRAWDAYS